MKIFRTDKANEDLLNVYSFLAERSPTAAYALVRDIDAKFKDLARFPFIGRERNGLAPGVRSLVVGTHLIFYTVQSERILILRIIDGRRDVEEEFRR
jgi:toxin ParE1/3/4